MLLRGLRWGLAGVLVAWTLIRLLGLDRGWPLVPLVAFTPLVAALAVLGALAAVVFGRRLFALLVGACTAVLIVGMAPRVIPNRAPADAPGVRLRVLAANVAGNAAAASDVVALARRLRVDVLSVVELPPSVALAYDAAGIGELLPQRSLRTLPGFAGTGLYARVPLQSAPGPQDTRFGISSAAATAPGAAPVALLAVHVPAPTGPDDARQWRHDIRALPATGPTGQLRVLAGDFNATLDHGELRRLLGRGYRDAAEQAGSGLRATWPTNRSLLPAVVTIDHVLADRRVRVASARTVTIPGSDHRGLLAELVLPRG
jgi:endonuclease/exonuclease/phosphatase (EEP) superfamily protein YafD